MEARRLSCFPFGGGRALERGPELVHHESVPGPGGVPISLADWRALPELPMATIADEGDSASVYAVVRVGFIPAKIAEARAAGIAGTDADGPAGMVPLPTVTVRSAEGERLFRLPAELNGWAVDVVALAHGGQNLFPCEIEFGVLRGLPFAEFVLAKSRTN